jgi:hypothetical protein
MSEMTGKSMAGESHLRWVHSSMQKERFSRGSLERLLLFLSISVLIFGCKRVSDEWDGTWKLDPFRCQLPGSNFQIALDGQGQYSIDYGAFKEHFRCDGQEYSLISGKTISCIQRSASAFDSTAKKDGILLNTAHWELSADQTRLSITMTAPRSHGPVRSKEIVYERTAGTKGFEGTWRDVNSLSDRPQLLVLAVHDQNLHYGFPEVGQYADVELNGSEAPWNGPNTPQGSTIAVRVQDRRSFLVFRKIGGQILNQGSMQISADGRTLVEEVWSPDRPDLKTILVYEKQ